MNELANHLPKCYAELFIAMLSILAAQLKLLEGIKKSRCLEQLNHNSQGYYPAISVCVCVFKLLRQFHCAVIYENHCFREIVSFNSHKTPSHYDVHFIGEKAESLKRIHVLSKVSPGSNRGFSGAREQVPSLAKSLLVLTTPSTAKFYPTRKMPQGDSRQRQEDHGHFEALGREPQTTYIQGLKQRGKQDGEKGTRTALVLFGKGRSPNGPGPQIGSSVWKGDM